MAIAERKTFIYFHLFYITGCKPSDLCIWYSTKRMQGAAGSLSALRGWRLQQFRSQVFIPGVKSSHKHHTGENLLHPCLVMLARFLWTSSCALHCHQRNECFGDSSGTATHARKKEAFEILWAYESFSSFSVWIASSCNLEGISKGWVIKEWAPMLPCVQFTDAQGCHVPFSLSLIFSFSTKSVIWKGIVFEGIRWPQLKALWAVIKTFSYDSILYVNNQCWSIGLTRKEDEHQSCPDIQEKHHGEI